MMRWLGSGQFLIGFAMLAAIQVGGTLTAAAVGEQDRIIASPEPGWPQWRGPRRDGTSDETGLLSAWPEGGPKELWSVSNLGRGWSAPIVAGGRIFITGDFEERLEIIALDLTSRELWRATNGLSWRREYPGARSAAAFNGGRLFHKNAHGRVACLDPQTGRELWAVDVLERFDGTNITWGLSEGLLVDGHRVFVTAGGSKALVAALDVRRGETLWTSEPIRLGNSPSPNLERAPRPPGEVDSAGYASPVLVQLAGRKQVVGCSLRHLFGVDAETGQLLWTRPFVTRYSVIAASPTVFGDAVFVTAPDAGGGRAYRVLADGAGVRVESFWESKLDSGQGGVVYHDRKLFGSWYRGRKGWAAIDARSGEVLHELPEMAMGPLLYADGRFYWLSQEGEMTLVEYSPQGFQFRGRFRFVPDKVNDAWAHPVIHERRLYLRYHERLVCYDIARRP